ncbi:hypothetical protein Esti_005751 [Eimeria stiedai]
MGNLLNSECVEKEGACSCLRGEPLDEAAAEVSGEGEGAPSYEPAAEAAQAGARGPPSRSRSRSSSSSRSAAAKGRPSARGKKQPKAGGPQREQATTAAAPAAASGEGAAADSPRTAAAAAAAAATAAAEEEAAHEREAEKERQAAAETLAAAKRHEQEERKAAAERQEEEEKQAAAERRAEKERQAAAAKQKVEDYVNFWVVGSRRPPVEETVLRQIVRGPLKIQETLLRSLYLSWVPDGAEMTIAELPAMTRFLCRNTCIQKSQDIDELLFQRVSANGTVPVEEFVLLVELLTKQDKRLAQAFKGLQPQPDQNDNKVLVVELPDARAALRQLCETAFKGDWIGERAIERMLDLLVVNTDFFVPLEVFLVLSQTLATIVRCLNLLYHPTIEQQQQQLLLKDHFRRPPTQSK